MHRRGQGPGRNGAPGLALLSGHVLSNPSRGGKFPTSSRATASRVEKAMEENS